MAMLAPRWMVEVDLRKCTLCDVCAQRCPTGALSVHRQDRTQKLVFEPSACHGCSGEPHCLEVCPESCVTVSRSESRGPIRTRVLASGRLARCVKCGAAFAAQKKLSTVTRRSRGRRKLDADRYCPLCRRDELLRNLIP